ncbi:hypothetical protein Amsp01_040180 [Amycolatopsis sp. NBRC 101858]|nr:hypothetical protein Amsp01_040180 [Amycolatopsis sp. NBRC 101858]
MARASNTWHLPSGESPPNRTAVRALSALRLRVTPPARATVHSPASRLAQAVCTATSEEDWAASITKLGPRSPKA